MTQADDRVVNDIAEAIAASGRWRIVHNENPGFATLERPRDGLRIDINYVYKQKTLEVKINVQHLKIWRERQWEVAKRHTTRARPTMSDVISAIDRVLLSGEQEYRELVKEVEEAARKRRKMLADFEEVVKAFGGTVKGPPSWNGNDEDYTPSCWINTPGLNLYLEPGHDDKIRITGHSNDINTNLLLCLIPVIKQWQQEQQETTHEG